MINATKCKHCSGLNFCKKGFRKTNNRGQIQKYYVGTATSFYK